MKTSNLLFKINLVICLLAMFNASAQQSVKARMDDPKYRPGSKIIEIPQTKTLKSIKSSDTIYYEDFSQPPSDWTLDENWSNHDGHLRLAWDSTMENFDLSAISPIISLPENVSDFDFTIGSYIYFAVDEIMEVSVIHDSGEDIIYSYELVQGGEGEIKKSVSLVPYANQDIQLRFRSYGSSTANLMYYFYFDNLTISTDYNNDLSITNFTGNFSPIQNSTQTYTVEVINSGINMQSIYNVKLMKEGDIELGNLDGITLNHNDTAYYEFEWTPTVAEDTYIWAEVIGWDQDPNDNTMQKNVTVIPEGATTSQVTIEVSTDYFYSGSSWNLWNVASQLYYYDENQTFTEQHQTITEVVDIYDGDYEVHCFDGWTDGGISGTVSNEDGFVVATWSKNMYKDFGAFDFGIYHLENNLWAKNINGNLSPSVNNPSIYSSTIVNMGTNTQSNYTVKLMKEGDVELSSLDGVELAQYESHTFEFEWTPDAEGETNIWVEVILEGDEHLEDNVTNIKNVNVYPEGIIAVTIGDGERLNASPVVHNWECSLTEQIYLQDELEPGVINAIQFYSSFVEIPEECNITIWMGETTWNEFDGIAQEIIPSTELTQVYTGNPDWEIGEGMLNVQFDNLFNYTGENNLVVMVKNLFSDEYYSYDNKYYHTPVLERRNILKWHVLDIDETISNPVSAGYTTKTLIPNVSFFYEEEIILEAPTNLTAEVIDQDVHLDWDAPALDEVTGYNIYHSYESGAFELLENVAETTYDHVEAEIGHHQYYVTAVYSEGESTATNTVEAEIMNIAKLYGNNFVIYPNPASDLITIKTNSTIEKYTIYNNLGTLVKHGSITSNMLNIDISDLAAGTYTINILTSSDLISRKLVIK